MCRYNVIWPSQGFTCVNVCLLNRLDFFLKYKSWLDLFSVCVCVFLGSMCLKLLLRDDFERFISCLDHWLCCMFMFFSSRKTVFKKLARHLLDTWLSVELPSFFFLLQSRHLLDTFWIDRESSYLLDSFSMTARSIDRVSILDIGGLFLDT